MTQDTNHERKKEMTAIYFSKQDYRSAMQYPYSASRAHAIARHVSATASQRTPLYAALYWRACKDLHAANCPPEIAEKHRDYYDNYGYKEFCHECDSFYPQLTQNQINKLWTLATRKVRAALEEAISLQSSVLW